MSLKTVNLTRNKQSETLRVYYTMPGVKPASPASQLKNKYGKRSTGVLITIFTKVSLIFLFGLAFTASTEYPR